MISTLKQNLLANFFGKGWATLMAIVFVPLYIRFIGVEAYGLIAFFASLQAMTSLLDMGLSSTINREMARNSAKENRAQIMSDTLRTLETVYVFISVAICFAIVLLAPFIARHWLNVKCLSVDSVTRALILMGVVIAVRFPIALYSGGLLGLERQVLYNKLLVFFATLRSGGAILILWLVSPTVYAFFIWQAGTSLFQTAIFAIVLWRSMPISDTRPLFKKGILVNIWRFAAGMTGISVFGVILMQMDKIVLSKLLTLEMFGYYSIASLLGYGVYVMVAPFFNALFPRFSYLVSKGDEEGLVSLYHRSCQFLSSLILPVVFVVAVFSKEILLAWTHNPLIAEKTYRLASILIIGAGLNGLMNIPYALALAYGWTRLGVYANIGGVILLMPLVYVMTKWYGAIGAAFVWVILNAGYVAIVIPIMHTKLLKSEKSAWYIHDVGLPLIGALGVALLGKKLFSSPDIIEAVIYISVILGMSIFVAALTTSYLRNTMKAFFTERH